MNKGKILFWSLTGLVVLAGGAYAFMYIKKQMDAKKLLNEGAEGEAEKSSGEPASQPRKNPYISVPDAPKTSTTDSGKGQPSYTYKSAALENIARNIGFSSKLKVTEQTVNYIFGKNGRSEYVAYIYDNGRFIVKGVYSKKEVVRGSYTDNMKSFKTDGASPYNWVSTPGLAPAKNFEKLADYLIKKGLI